MSLTSPLHAELARRQTAKPDPLPLSIDPIPPLEVLMDPDPGLPRCIDCGCTEQLACPGGCYWADSTRLGLPEVPLCSQCYARRAAHMDGRVYHPVFVIGEAGLIVLVSQLAALRRFLEFAHIDVPSITRQRYSPVAFVAISRPQRHRAIAYGAIGLHPARVADVVLSLGGRPVGVLS